VNKSNENILAICGFKKSGKTTLIEALLLELVPKGLRLGVIKHQNKPVQTDQPGTDTFRFFQAGASVLGFDGVSTFVKQKQSLPFSLEQALRRLGPDFDFILIEGFKESDAPKIWLLRNGETAPPDQITNILATLTVSDDRLKRVLKLIRDQFLMEI